MKRKVICLLTVLFCGVQINAQEVNTDTYIKLSVKKGGQVRCAVGTDKANTAVKIVCGSWDTTFVCAVYGTNQNTTSLDYIVATDDEYIIYGDVQYLYCQYQFENICGMDISHNSSLKKLKTDRNSIEYIDLTNSVDLEYLCIWNNMLKSLDLSHCPNIQTLYVDGNDWTTEELDNMMCSLPDRTGQSKGLLEPIYDEADENYEAFMSSNSQNAKDKNWKVANGKEVVLPATNGEFKCLNASLEEEKDIAKVTVYPNPTSDCINIVANGVIKRIELVNMSGQKVYSSSENSDKVTIPTNKFPNGNYVVAIQTDQTVTYKNIVIE